MTTINHRGDSVMAWGCFSTPGVGDLVRIVGKLNTEHCLEKVKKRAIPSGFLEAVSSGTSLLLASISAVFLFSGMQMYLSWIIATHIRTIFGGYLGSLLFVFLLTSVGNLETCLFGKSFQVKIFPEVLFCLFLAVTSCALIHRVCATSCLLFSIIHLHFLNKYSQKVYSVQAPAQVVQTGKRKK